MAVKGFERRKSAADVLLGKGLLTAEQIKDIDAAAKKASKSFQEMAAQMNLVDRKKLLQSLSEEWQVKSIDLTQAEIDEETAKSVPETVARRHLAMPFAKKDSALMIAMSDPFDFFVSEDLNLRTGLEVVPHLALPGDILAALNKLYGRTENEAMNRLLADVVKKQEETLPEGTLQTVDESATKSDITEVDASAPEVEKLVNAVILGALSMKASDIHVEPFEDSMGKESRIAVRYRVDGMLTNAPFNVPWSFRNAIMAKIKIMTNSMNITERRIPQSGRIQILAQGNPIEFRVEMVPTVYGESCVMRILDRKSVQVDINQMGFLPDTQAKLLSLFKGIGGKKNFGIILVCGPTGSGKSTTLYAALNYVNRPDIKILTAENPVEYNVEGIVQVPVNPDLKLGEDKKFDFSMALRSFLRLDPDVIMVGEIRDEETAHIAMEAAMTGHLVFSTIHTNDASSVVPRFIQMGIPAFMVASTIKAILAQRLSRRLCPKCKVERAPTADEVKVFEANQVKLPAGAKVFAPSPAGCENCKSLGFKGRVGLHELLVMSDGLRGLALKEADGETIRVLAAKEGMRAIVQDGLEKVLMGLTTVREVIGGVEEK